MARIPRGGLTPATSISAAPPVPQPQGRPPAAPNAALAALCMIAAALASSAMSAAVRHVSAEIHPFEIGFFRNLFGFIALAPFLIRGGARVLRTSQPMLHGVRGVTNAVAMLLWFYGLSITPLALAAALSFLSPLFATVLAVAFLGERMRARRWTALIIGFIGALIILRPDGAGVGFGPALVACSSALWACSLTTIKVLSREDGAATITGLAALMLTPICLIAAIPVWTTPGLQTLGLLAVIGALGTCAQLGVSRALALAESGAVMPFDFTKLIWAAIFGWFMFDETPDVATFLGGGVIVAAVSYIAYREARQRGR